MVLFTFDIYENCKLPVSANPQILQSTARPNQRREHPWVTLGGRGRGSCPLSSWSINLRAKYIPRSWGLLTSCRPRLRRLTRCKWVGWIRQSGCDYLFVKTSLDLADPRLFHIFDYTLSSFLLLFICFRLLIYLAKAASLANMRVRKQKKMSYLVLFT